MYCGIMQVEPGFLRFAQIYICAGGIRAVGFGMPKIPQKKASQKALPMPPIHKIVAAQAAIWKPRLYTAEQAETHCWACRGVCAPERAHIVARSGNGSCDPTNFLLLCWICHREQPDGQPLAVQLAWLNTREDATHRIERTIAPMLTALQAAAGDDETVNAWARIADSNAIMQTAVATPGGTRPSNELANAHWGMLTDFLAWKARQ